MLWFETFWGSDSNKTNHVTYIFATYDTPKKSLLSCCSYICFFLSVLTCFASTTKNIDRLSICAFGVVTSSFWIVRPKLTKKSTMTTDLGLKRPYTGLQNSSQPSYVCQLILCFKFFLSFFLFSLSLFPKTWDLIIRSQYNPRLRFGYRKTQKLQNRASSLGL